MIKRLNLSLNDYLWLVILFVINKIMICKRDVKVMISEMNEKIKIRFLRLCESIRCDFISRIETTLNWLFEVDDGSEDLKFVSTKGLNQIISDHFISERVN